MKIYIAGAVTGLPWDDVVKKFEKSEKAIIKRGHEPINPLKIGIPQDTDWQPAMKACVKAVAEADAVFMQIDWRNSNGAIIEHRLARGLRYPIFYNVKQIPDNN